MGSLRQRVVACVAAIFAAIVACALPACAQPLQIGPEAGTSSPVLIEPEILFHTLVADFFVQNDGTEYVQTGDIPAMWLRDASAQTLPYVRLARVRPALRTWIRGVIERNARNVNVDPYANAFSANYRVWERKWEVDSLAYPALLAWTYEQSSGDRRIYSPALHDALRRTVATYACEQRHDACSRYVHPELSNGGRGEASVQDGMIWSGFRPSDDPTTYPYNIPDQMLASVALDDVAELALRGYQDRALANAAGAIAVAVRASVEKFGTVYSFRNGWIYAYEVDGGARRVAMDDANVPSLLAAPITGYLAGDDPHYRATRAFALSPQNPYYYRGRYAAGIGSPHTPRGWVWPLALIARALTAETSDEAMAQVRVLAATDSEDGLIHESFDPDDTSKFTRAEFGWGNALFAELLFREAAGFTAQPGHATEAFPFRPRRNTPPIRIAGTIDRLVNRGLLLRAFEKACPFPVTAADPE